MRSRLQFGMKIPKNRNTRLTLGQTPAAGPAGHGRPDPTACPLPHPA
jgi:hypothetical protein